jgi:hypothetical protein
MVQWVERGAISYNLFTGSFVEINTIAVVILLHTKNENIVVNHPMIIHIQFRYFNIGIYVKINEIFCKLYMSEHRLCLAD